MFDSCTCRLLQRCLTSALPQDPSLVEAMNGANKIRSYDIPPSSLERKFGAAPKPAAKPAARAAPKPAARAAPKPAAKPAAGRPGTARK